MLRRALVCLLLLATASPAAAEEERTVSGEVVDVRCYRASPDNAGRAHTDCALSCARRGATLGIRTDDGIYVIVGDYTARSNERLIAFVAREVTATGEVSARDGVRTIRVQSMHARN